MITTKEITSTENLSTHEQCVTNITNDRIMNADQHDVISMNANSNDNILDNEAALFLYDFIFIKF